MKCVADWELVCAAFSASEAPLSELLSFYEEEEEEGGELNRGRGESTTPKFTGTHLWDYRLLEATACDAFYPYAHI